MRSIRHAQEDIEVDHLVKVGYRYWAVRFDTVTEERADSVRAMLRHSVSPNLNAASGVCFTLLMKLRPIDCLLHCARAQGWTVSGSEDAKSSR